MDRVLTHEGLERVHLDIGVLEGLVKAKMADPELLREAYRQHGFVQAGDFLAARADVMAAPYAGTISYPLAPGTFTNTQFTIDIALNNPTRVITPMVVDISRQRFFVDRIFTSAGGVSGGAIVYDMVAAASPYADRDVQRVEPGTEFPITTFSRRAPSAAQVEKWGAKFFYTDEARDRNDVVQFTNAMRQLTNTIVRKINQRGVQILEALITANSRTVSGNSWGSVNTLTGAGGSNFTAYPARDFAKADLQSEQEELGIDYNLWILNPVEVFNLQGIYGDKLSALLASFGISIYATNRIAAGTGYAVAEGQVGEMRTEQPLMTETWRDPNGKQQTWVQSSVRPAMFGNNPFAVLKFTGLT